MKGSIKNQVNQLWREVDGIGKSKAKTRSESSYKGQNGHKVSELVHSFQSKDEFIRVATELANFAKSEFGIKDMQQINSEVIQAYFADKIEDGLFRRSLSSYASVISKIQVGLSKMPLKLEKHSTLFTQKDIKDIRQVIDKEALRKEHLNRAYNNPQSLLNYMSKDTKLGFELQLNHGIRVAEATLIRASQLLENNTLKIQGKGGYMREILLEKALYERLKAEIKANGSYKVSYDKYVQNLKKATQKNGEKWQSTHGLRYNYAQKKYAEYVKKMTHEEALKRVSFELGHHRVEITNHYLR